MPTSVIYQSNQNGATNFLPQSLLGFLMQKEARTRVSLKNVRDILIWPPTWPEGRSTLKL
jgi:hypothetical protein